MCNTNKVLAASALMLTLAGNAVGADSIEIGGNYDTSANVGSVTSVAIGEYANADINVAGIQANGSSVSVGSFGSHVSTGSVTAVSIGPFGTGPINLGGIQTQ